MLQSDNGSAFVNSIIKQLMSLGGIDHRLVSPYHPRANGLAERHVRTVMESIRKSMDKAEDSWSAGVRI